MIVRMKLLLLHPLPLDGSIFPDEIREVAGECVAPTLYDVGGSDIGDWARAALESVGDGPFVVIGNSIGGSCAVEVTKLVPERVRALVLSGAKAGHRPEPDYRDRALRVLEEDGLRAAWERYWLPLFGPFAPAAMIDRGWRIAEKLGAARIAAGVRAFHSRPDRDAFIRTWPGPVTIVSGEHDVRPDRSRRLADDLLNGSFRLIPAVGHYVPLEAPTALVDIVAEAVAALE